MRFPLLLLAVLVVPLAARSQFTEDALKTRLLHQPLYLRQQCGPDRLHFDGSGSVLGVSPRVPFTLSGIDIVSVKLKGNSLELGARRVGLEFVKQVPKRVVLQVFNQGAPGTHKEEMKLVIDAPSSGDYGPALQAIFADKLEDMVPRMPLEWQSFAKAHLLQPGLAEPPLQAVVRKVGGGVSAPVVLKSPEPEFTEAARGVRWSGKVLVYFQVDESGKVSHERLLKPLGLGLDENALAAVSKYQFKPAMEGINPVKVELNVEVSFDIY